MNGEDISSVLTQEDLMKELDLTKSQIAKMRKNGLRFMNPGRGRFLYLEKEVMLYLNEHMKQLNSGSKPPNNVPMTR